MTPFPQWYSFLGSGYVLGGPLPGVAIVAEQDAWLARDADVTASNILTARPDLDIVWAAGEEGRRLSGRAEEPG